jgi:hypothetical protein
VTADELRGLFARTQEIGLLNPAAMRAARARVEWRPSLQTLDQVIAEFCEQPAWYHGDTFGAWP